MARFDEKIVLITGAASGIGRASALRIASEGGTVVCVDFNEQALNETVSTITEAGNKAFAITCDVTNEESVEATVAKTIEKFGKLNALCNIAGILRFDHTHEMDMKDFDRVMQVNCYGLIMMTKACIPHLLETKGFIVNMSSSSALGGQAWTAAYAASKGAVLSFTKCIANEYGIKRLNCNAICPGGIETPMVGGAQLPEGFDARLITKSMLPDGYFAPASDVASAVAFLACEDANHINGDHIRLDGGLLS